MKPSEQKMTPKQDRALMALLSHGTTEAAYGAAGVSKSTMWRFLQDAGFQARYRAARRQLVETAVAQLQGDCTIAVRVLREVAEDKEAPASSRVSAARTILEQRINAVELIDLQERVEALEDMTEEAQQSQQGRKSWA